MHPNEGSTVAVDASKSVENYTIHGKSVQIIEIIKKINE